MHDLELSTKKQQLNYSEPVSLKRIFNVWWPLAASWLLMGAELPVVSAILARLDNPEINLAAYGSIVMPLSLIIEAPIIMLLAASTALSKNFPAFRKLRQYMVIMSGVLTFGHIIIAFTPLYDIVVGRIINPPQEIIEPARIGLMIMTPWTAAIAYRRFHQGLLIRYNHSRAIGVGSAIRLISEVLILTVGFLVHNIPGVIVAAVSVALGVISEAVYIGIIVRPVIRCELSPEKNGSFEINFVSFFRFYIPLATTSILFLLAQPMVTIALSRMPKALESLALWPVISGMIFIYRSVGMAYNEVVVALLDEPKSSGKLLQFTIMLAVGSTGVMLLTLVTPLSKIWLGDVTGIKEILIPVALNGLWAGLPLPALTVMQNWYQGIILFGKKTRGITESVSIYLLLIALILWAGVTWGKMSGLVVGVLAIGISLFAQMIWLRYRSQPAFQMAITRDKPQKRS